MADGAMVGGGREARNAPPRCLVRRVLYGSSAGSYQSGRDDVASPATPCFTVDAEDADLFGARIQVDLEGI